MGKLNQYAAIDEAVRTAQFVRNKCIRFWIDNRGVGQKDLYRHSTALREEFAFVKDLNSSACQASVERAYSAIARFYDNCKKAVPGKKGYPTFKKNSRSVEYKVSGWKLSETRKQIISADNNVDTTPAGKTVGLDVGLKEFYTDSDGHVEPNPKFYRKSEKQLKFRQRRVSRKKKGSANRKKAINRLGRVHLKISRQREEHAKKLARCVIQSNDLVAYENLRIKNLVKNHCLAKSINDAGWYQFRKWLEYFGVKFGRVTVAVNPAYTSQKCSNCGAIVKKSLSVRTHACECGFVMDRDWNAAINILKLALSTVGHTGTWVLNPNALGDSTSTLTLRNPV
ncbi:MAG: transposase [Oscillatoriales cyanobacterium]|nr:MAG: transposase [Oscillatoriales cyanobacterium]